MRSTTARSWPRCSTWCVGGGRIPIVRPAAPLEEPKAVAAKAASPRLAVRLAIQALGENRDDAEAEMEWLWAWAEREASDEQRGGMLHGSAVADHAPALRRLLAVGLDKDWARPETEWTALMAAAYDGSETCLRVLLDAGAVGGQAGSHRMDRPHVRCHGRARGDRAAAAAAWRVQGAAGRVRRDRAATRAEAWPHRLRAAANVTPFHRHRCSVRGATRVGAGHHRGVDFGRGLIRVVAMRTTHSAQWQRVRK